MLSLFPSQFAAQKFPWERFKGENILKKQGFDVVRGSGAIDSNVDTGAFLNFAFEAALLPVHFDVLFFNFKWLPVYSDVTISE